MQLADSISELWQGQLKLRKPHERGLIKEGCFVPFRCSLDVRWICDLPLHVRWISLLLLVRYETRVGTTCKMFVGLRCHLP